MTSRTDIKALESTNATRAASDRTKTGAAHQLREILTTAAETMIDLGAATEYQMVGIAIQLCKASDFLLTGGNAPQYGMTAKIMEQHTAIIMAEDKVAASMAGSATLLDRETAKLESMEREQEAVAIWHQANCEAYRRATGKEWTPTPSKATTPRGPVADRLAKYL